MKTKFHYCPNCQSDQIEVILDRKMICRSCEMEYYQNVATATAVILRRHDEILFTVRNREPKKYMFDLPGGFVDPDESAEEGAQRELKEELDLDIDLKNFKYLMSKPNHYEYKGILYKTCDLAFEVEFPNNAEMKIEKEEINAVKWVKLKDVNLDEIGFDSLRYIVEQYLLKHL